MENQLQIFNNPEFGTIRTILIDGEIWFVAADVCRALDLTNVTRALSGLNENEKSKIDENRITTDPNYYEGSTDTPFVENDNPFLREVNIVNEPGLYHLIFQSRKPNAVKFQRWVYHEVLPSIRKYGYYALPNLELYVRNRLKNFIESDKDKEKLEETLPALSEQLSKLIEKTLADFEKNKVVAIVTVEDLPGELWKNIKGYKGLYQVSTRGRVKSFQLGKVTILKQSPDDRGYMYVTLCKKSKNGKKNKNKNKNKKERLNRLVAEAFIPNLNKLPVVHHKDNNPANNDVTNLEWTTSEGNKNYAVKDRRYKSGENHPHAKLTEEQVLYICKVYIPRDSEFGQAALSRKFNVSKSTIRCVITGENWKYIGTDEERKCTPNTAKKPKKLTEEQVRFIREKYIPHHPEFGQGALARKFGVSRAAVELVVQGKNWKNLK